MSGPEDRYSNLRGGPDSEPDPEERGPHCAACGKTGLLSATWISATTSVLLCNDPQTCGQPPAAWFVAAEEAELRRLADDEPKPPPERE